MGSGRHGAARPPIGVLIRLDRADFLLLGLQIVLAIAVMALVGPMSIAFWLAIVAVVVSIVLAIRRIDRLSRAELRGDDLL
jgi:membrane associated rhomboid family serine protease